MNPYPLVNSELKSILNTWMDFFLQQDRTPFTDRRHMKHLSGFKGNINADSACSEEYLAYMQAKPKGVPPLGVDGFPEDTYGCDLSMSCPPNYFPHVSKLHKDLLTFFGGRNSAVTMYYPKGGYMAWHHNANAAGLNILLSWSKDGTGFFRYQDPKTKEVVTMPDSPGWTVKAGYYGRWDEPEHTYWHCANAKHEERLTLGFIVPHEGLWTSMIESITEDY